MSEGESTETETETEVAQDRLDKHPRFIQVNREKKEYAKRVAELEAQLAPLQAKAQRATELEAELTSARSRWDEDAALMRGGLLDDDAREVARLLHSRIPEADRKPLPEMLAAWKEAPDTAPLALRGYLAPPAAPAPAPAAPGARPVPAAAPASGSSAPTDAEIKAATDALGRPGSPGFAERAKALQLLLDARRAPR